MSVVNDPHRKAGCKYDGSLSWQSQVDWAVYHAPGWEAWQEKRAKMVGTTNQEKLRVLQAHPQESRQDVIRVLNYCRSMRGQWSVEPGFKALAAKLNDRWKGMNP